MEWSSTSLFVFTACIYLCSYICLSCFNQSCDHVPVYNADIELQSNLIDILILILIFLNSYCSFLALFHSYSDEDDDSDEDDEMELQMELERIKAERAVAQAKKDQEEKDLQTKKNTENAMKGNPLVNMSDNDSSKVKRRWNDDVVFRNQTRDEPEHKKRFINDTIRNDFHRQFLKKFMK